MTRREPAPVFTDSFVLCDWLIDRMGRDMAVLPQTVCRTALVLLDHVVLALQGIDREIHIDGADEHLITLRVYLRLAQSTGYLDESQVMHALALTDRIGRQLGGWQRSIEAAV